MNIIFKEFAMWFAIMLLPFILGYSYKYIWVYLSNSGFSDRNEEIRKLLDKGFGRLNDQELAKLRELRGY